MTEPLLISIQVGRPATRGRFRSEDLSEGRWRSAIFKHAVSDEVWLGRLNLAGDLQADRVHHGGPDQAVLAYSADHYPLWREELGVAAMGPGGFGENFTIAGLTGKTVCVGDIVAIGDCRLQVTKPRMPCWKLERRWGIPGLVERVLQNGRSGWYLRVLQEGFVRPGLPVLLLERLPGAVTIAEAFRAKAGKR
ncbi:MAG: MOSC domain-containing protein [Chthonomonadales bacterium]